MWKLNLVIGLPDDGQKPWINWTPGAPFTNMI